ncbi:MAG: hypothetical protein ACK57B_12270 [Betaproteobacteria bacterium]
MVTCQPAEIVSYTASKLQLIPMALLTSLLCLSLAACGGGDATESPESGAGSAGVVNPAPPRTTALQPGHQLLDVAPDELARVTLDWNTAHEALPAGVPAGYDWRERGAAHAGNRAPPNFAAFTGWAHAFWATGAPVGRQHLELRRMQTLLCKQAGGERRWQRVQQGGIEGASFKADFATGDNIPAEITPTDSGHVRVGFSEGRAFHWWPRQGRVTLATPELCGMLVLFQARAVAADGRELPPGTAPALLVGGGADYWLDTRVAWDQFRTNASVGVGPLRLAQPQWRWFGISTADAAALAQLQRDGYIDRATP